MDQPHLESNNQPYLSVEVSEQDRLQQWAANLSDLAAVAKGKVSVGRVSCSVSKI